jgi:anthranilate synthase component 2
LKVLLIDFYDSFTYNIYHYLIGLNIDVVVVEDKKVDLIVVDQFDCIIFSPGPGLPSSTISLFPVLELYANSKRILGICLGMQGIAEFYGAELFNQKVVKHGVAENITILKPENIFLNFPKVLRVGLYHSWAVDLTNSKSLDITAISENGILMAIQHSTLPIFAVQFHPESILTEKGKELLSNFIFST